MIRNIIKLDACKHAERLYNMYQVEVMEPATDASDERLNRISSLYREVLQECREYNLGGVLINGVFRNLHE